MTVIKQPNWRTLTGLPEPTVQQLGENPYTYRELLMADANGTPVPYYLPSVAAPKTFIRIPHGMSTDAPVRANGDLGDPNPVGAGHERIPDVAIPLLVDDPSNLGINMTVNNIALAWDPAGVLPSTTGLWADESYIYLSITALSPGPVQFVVYVEYTHSIIRNEIVTGQYYLAYAPIP